MRIATVTMSILAMAAFVGCGDKETTTAQGEGGKELKLTAPSDVTLHRGGTAKVEIKIGRKDLPGDVSVSFDKLPDGVSVVDGDKKIVGEEGTYNLKAEDDADLVENSQVQVSVKGPEGLGATQMFKVTVREKE